MWPKKHDISILFHYFILTVFITVNSGISVAAGTNQFFMKQKEK